MKKQKHGPAHYRQGDVIIERIDALPKNIKPVAREGGRVILAHGEVTGHAHAIAERGTEKFTDESGREFFRIHGEQIQTRLKIQRAWRNQVMVKHPKLGLLEFAKADVVIEGDHALINGEFGLLKHDEHNTHAIPAGLYRGGNAADGKVYQREYSPEEIRRVAD